MDGWLDTDTEYSLDDLKRIAEDQLKYTLGNSPQDPMLSLITHYKVKAWTEYGYYGDSDRAEFKLFFYRMETDQEYETRLAYEESLKSKAQIASEKRKAATTARKEAKALESAKLLEDPDYVKFLELKQKYGKAKIK